MVKVRVWDLPLRCFHWALLALVLFSAGSGLLGEELGAGAAEWHARSGYGILSLLVFRFVWGFCGGAQARFASFLRGPAAVADYLRRALRGEAPFALGHNPAGGWSVAAMLVALALQAVSGLFLADEDTAFAAPLSKYVSHRTEDALGAFHEFNAALLFGFVALHLAAIAYYHFVKREGLVRAMISGEKSLPTQPDAPVRGGAAWLGALIYAGSLGAVLALVLLA